MTPSAWRADFASVVLHRHGIEIAYEYCNPLVTMVGIVVVCDGSE